MSLYQEYDSQARAFLSSLQKSVKEVTLPSYFSTSATVHALQGLQKKTKLKNLKLACSDRSVWAALGTLLKESASINSLTINVFLCSFGEEFLSGLRINSGLTKLVLLDSLRVLNADHYSALMKALNSNPTVCEVTMKQSHEVSFDISRGQKAVLSFDDDPLEQLIQNSDWESLKPNIICDLPSVSTCQLIQNNDWENLAQHLKENCSSADPADYAEQFNLSTRTFVDKLAVHTLKEYYDDTCQESVILEVSVVETSKLRDVLSNEQEELRRKLQLIEQKLVEVDTKLVEDSNKLEEKATLIQQLKTNIEHFKASLAKNEPELTQWQRKLQVDMSDWTTEDVTFLLEEVGLDQYAYEFALNKIDGAVLQAMDTGDLTANLNVSFKDAKRMLMYIYLAEKHHDIYNIPPGVLQWNNDTVCTWLEDNKFAHLVDLFKKNQITGAELAFLEKGDLTAQLKIQAFGDVVKLQKEIAKLKESLNDEQTRAMQTINNNNANNNNDQLVRQLEEVKRFNEELKIALKKKETKIPEAFICPITQDIMTDPVFASDGHTYERTAIELWLKNKNSSPMTGLQLANKVLTPSHTLKSMIREFVDTNKN